MVDERANEVAHEIQEAKNAGMCRIIENLNSRKRKCFTSFSMQRANI